MSIFEKWFSAQQAAGLVDFKVSINAFPGVTAEAVKGEILAAESALASGLLRSAPVATSRSPADIENILRASSVFAAH